MRVVVDTNVFVSAALKDKSFPALALHVMAQQRMSYIEDVTHKQNE